MLPAHATRSNARSAKGVESIVVVTTRTVRPAACIRSESISRAWLTTSVQVTSDLHPVSTSESRRVPEPNSRIRSPGRSVDRIAHSYASYCAGSTRGIDEAPDSNGRGARDSTSAIASYRYRSRSCGPRGSGMCGILRRIGISAYRGQRFEALCQQCVREPRFEAGAVELSGCCSHRHTAFRREYRPHGCDELAGVSWLVRAATTSCASSSRGLPRRGDTTGSRP